MKNLIFVCFCLILAIPVNTALALPGSGTQEDPWRIESLADFNEFAADANYPAFEEPNHAERPEYVENEIIVKFRGNSTDAIEMGVAKGIAAHELKLSDSLDNLNKKYKLKKAQPLFKNFKANRERVKALLSKDKAQLSKKERHIVNRLKRAPKDAKVPDLSRIYKLELELETGQSLQEAVEAYENHPNVEYAELNYVVSINLTPNDPHYPIQWPLNNTGQMYPESGNYNHPPGTSDCDIDAPEAWDIYTGDSEIIVAVIDTGIDYTHGDIDDNMWVNGGEITDNGVDDDGNGYIDDVYGYDFRNNDGDPQDDDGHGTHCAGIVAAEGDNDLDIAGVCWDARIMALKFLGAGGWGTTSAAVSAFYYAVENGADITSNSWGGGSYLRTLEEAIAYAHSQGVINVASAGNDNSTAPPYPAYYKHMIAVAATDSDDRKAPFSNYGDWVDIAAPGVDVLSLRADGTSMGTTYDDYTTIASGTSMACPHFAGACALLLSLNTTLTNDDVYDILMGTVDPIADGICLSDGRLNIFNATLEAVQSKGFIILDDNYYSCASDVDIRLADCDLAGQGSQAVTLATDGGDSETLILAEETPAIGVFTGTISTISGDPDVEDGIVQVAHGQIMIVTYEDADDGTGNPAIVTDLAETDCQAPAIFNVGIDAPGPEPTVTFETDEPTTARVLCGLSCSEPNDIIATDSTLGTTHTLQLAGVLPETDYHFIIEATDAVGNTTVDDNNGQCYTFTTTGSGDVYVPSECPTIQRAIDISWDGGTVWVADGTYTGEGNRDIDFLGKAITVRSENGPENCIINCNGTEDEPHRGFVFRNYEDANSILAGFTITNGYARSGGGIYCQESNLTITNCIISSNTSTGDRSYGGGGIYCQESNLTITNCIISSNTSTGDRSYGGGGICCQDSSLMIASCTISDNGPRYGGIFCKNGSLTVANCIISSNKGSGIDCSGRSHSTITNCTITSNVADSGGGISCGAKGTLAITNCTISDNSAHGAGGIGCGDSNATITNCTIKSNEAHIGGGIVCGSSTTIANCTISDNKAGLIGGGIYCDDSNPTITNCTISNNTILEKFGWGAGIYCRDSNPTITKCTITGNSGSTWGGGICLRSDSSPTITDCTISDNSADRESSKGGGILCSYRSRPTITNCVFSRNKARGGGAMSNSFWSRPKLTNCTFVANSGGIHSIQSRPTIANCILWDNGYEISSDNDSIVTITYSNVEGGWPGEGNINADPCFAFSDDYHLMPDSACIDAGTNTPIGGLPTTDIDGNPRILNGNDDGTAFSDMGAYEYNPNSPSIAVSPWMVCFSYVRGEPPPEPETLLIRNCGGGTLNWEMLEDCDWLQATPIKGISTAEIDEVTLTVDPNALISSSHSCTLEVIDSNAVNTPVTVHVYVPRTLYVPSEYETIQAAIDAAVDNDVVLVADGIYTGPGNRDINFKGNAITVRSENGPENCIIDCKGTEHEPHRAFYLNRLETVNSIIDGFTLANGWAWYGAGVCCSYASPTIRNCIVRDNIVRSSGGGIYCSASSAAIMNCLIMDNASMGETYGFGEYSNGGGIYCSSGNITISNCVIIGNTTDNKGGGVYFGGWYDSRLNIKNCAIISNSAKGLGGGLLCSSHNKVNNAMVANCTFADNSSSNGNALACDSYHQQYPSNLQVSNCILWDGGNEIWNNDGSTIAITYSNIEGSYPGQGNINADPCFVEPGYWDVNDIWVEGDYHLLEGSPCIDSGDPNYVAGPNETDLDGNPRIVDGDNDGNSVVDMGAYEYRPPTPAELVAELLEGVGGLELPRGIENGLEAKLEAALGALEDENENNDIAAINTLGAFINAVEAQRGKKIPEAEADALIAAAQEIIELLSAE